MHKKFTVGQAITMVLLLIIGLTLMYPLYWTITRAFMANNEIFTNITGWIPDKWLFSNFIDGWYAVGEYSFTRYYSNTLYVTMWVVIGATISNSLVGFGFARIRFKFRDVLFLIVLSVMMLPSQVTMIPIYMIWSTLGFTNSFVPLFFGAFFSSPFYVFLYRQNMASIPGELDEAATVDGCSILGIYWRIILPLSKPIVATIMLFSFGEGFGDFFYPLIYLRDNSKKTVTLALKSFMDAEGSSTWGPMLAMSLVAMIPGIVMFFISQRNMVNSMSTSGLKG